MVGLDKHLGRQLTNGDMAKYSEVAEKLIIKSRPFYKEKTKIWNNSIYIGYSHRIGLRDSSQSNTITKKDAKILLQKDLERISKQLNKHLTVKLAQNQYDALISLIYDIGIRAFISDGFLELINSNKVAEASVRFRKFNKYMKKPIYQLIKSRKLETELFNSNNKDDT